MSMSSSASTSPVLSLSSITDYNDTTEQLEEPLLIPNPSRYVLFPIQYPDMWKMYQDQVVSFWKAEEIDLSKDIQDWTEKLTKEERYYISMILAFFASSDGIVMENLVERFMSDVQVAEARAFYSFQIAMENIHSHTYSLLIETYVRNGHEKDRLFRAIENFPCIQRKAEWAQQWIQSRNASFAMRLLAFACVEGIFFSGAFCSIFWLKKRGLMPGLTFSNELISRDEALHCEFAVLLYHKLLHPLDETTVHAIIRDAVEIETDFICNALPCKLIGMNAGMMTQYIQYVADRLCLQLGYNKIFGVTNSCDFMDLTNLNRKTNMFESRISEYALANKVVTEDTFVLDGDF